MNIEKALSTYTDTWFIERKDTKAQLLQELAIEDLDCFLKLTEIVDQVSSIVYMQKKETLFQQIVEAREEISYMPMVANFRTENNADVSNETKSMIDELFSDILGDKNGK